MLQSLGSVSRTQSASPALTSAGRDYRIKLGDTLGDIAKRNGVSVDALMDANPEISNRNRIRTGQTITMPTGGKTVIVQRGDTLGKIAARNNTSVDALMAANKDIRNANQIYPGQVVRIAGESPKSAPKAAPRVQNTQSPVAKAPVGQAPVGPSVSSGKTTAGQINLKEFFDPAKGGKAPAAIIIGNAEGNRTPSGGTTSSYKGHIDPGNGKSNSGSFSYQHGAGLTPEQADKAQLTKLSKLIPAYEKAVRKAGLDPSNATLATAYFDLFNQSESAAARFLDQIGDLKATGITNLSVTDLRFHSFVDNTTGKRFTYTNGKGQTLTAGSGLAKIARDRLGRTPTEKEVQIVIRDDQKRRQNAMVVAMAAQGLVGKAASKQPTNIDPQPVANAQPGTIINPTGKGIRSDSGGSGEFHASRHRKNGPGLHKGLDILSTPGQAVKAPISGTLQISNPQNVHSGFKIVSDDGKTVVKVFYAKYDPALVGKRVVAGDSVAIAQDLQMSGKYPANVQDHVHVEVWKNGVQVNPKQLIF
jgi:LysM repeat protein